MRLESDHHTQDVTRLHGAQPPQQHASSTRVTAPLWPEESDAAHWLSQVDSIKVKGDKRQRRMEEEVKAEEMAGLHPESSFAVNRQKRCQRSTTFLSHTLLTGWRGFQSKADKQTQKSKLNRYSKCNSGCSLTRVSMKKGLRRFILAFNIPLDLRTAGFIAC